MWMVDLAALLVQSLMQDRSSALSMLLPLQGICILLTKTYLGGGYVSSKSNLESSLDEQGKACGFHLELIPKMEEFQIDLRMLLTYSIHTLE
ncbi:hypothetical protein DKX38_029909 [Salix brachista]|uniref:Uncharacterized protein n=1 Tax=Salix brachista TaxID=2182728 RepID=A0A5N5J0U1_9ROSI|nr:hypothetical protein DKX38_029909 [Salix brachista]